MNIEILLNVNIENVMENKIYITIQVYFKNMHFNKKDKFILEKLIKIKHSQHQYSALGEVKKA